MELINNTKEISNKFNKYFVNVGLNTEDSIPKTQNVSSLKFMKKRSNNVFLTAHFLHDFIKSFRE